MATYNTNGVTSVPADEEDKIVSSGLGSKPSRSSRARTADVSDNEVNPVTAMFRDIAARFTSAGATLSAPTRPKASTYRPDSGGSIYDGGMFDVPAGVPAPLDRNVDVSAIDSALEDAFSNAAVPQLYLATLGDPQPETTIDVAALQAPAPITVTEITVKAGDTLTAIAKDNGVPVQDVIDANPQIKNPDMIRPGDVVSVPDPRFEDVPKPRGVPDSPRLSDSTVTPTGTTTEPRDGPVGLMSPPAQDAVPEVDTDTAELGTPAEPSSRLDAKGSEVAGVTTKAYDFLTKTGFTPPENQLISDKMAITSNTRGTQFTNRADALEFIDNSLTLEPTRKAAFSATVAAESGSGLVEGTNYSKDGAIAVLGGGDADRIASIRRLYGNRNRLTADEQVELFNIAYGGRMDNSATEGHKFRGRGLIQITGKTNYLKYGKDIGVGDALVRDPDILIRNPSVMLAVTEAYLKDKLPEREDGLSANDLKDAIGHSGEVPRGVTWNGTGSAYKGNQRWLDVVGRLEDAGKQDEADAARLNNEFTAQEKVGTYIDGDIGPGSLRSMRSWLTERGVTIPEGTSARALVRLVNETE